MTATASAQDRYDQTQIQYLSGTDKDNTVDWEFYCTEGRNSGFWTTIPVPSCWEMMGFGAFNYGRDLRKDGLFYDRADEQGKYRHRFQAPVEWSGRRVRLVFEGVMTDAEVSVNGHSAGPVHQGAFYRFKYDVTDLLHYGAENLLEVTVSKMSSNASINEAERAGDYWLFGGIFRPVYLESSPAEHIRHVAIGAEADGSFVAQVHLDGVMRANTLTCVLTDSNSGMANEPISVEISPGQQYVELTANVNDPKTWNAESPTLYHATFHLSAGSRTIHTARERFGFRTVEIRPGEGIFVNGERVMMKGINRHVSWPDTGRTVSRGVDELDVRMLKEMNMNAVRTSHYPPDKSFLEVCDEQGIYVINELAGWHWAYDTDVGTPLVKAMVERDVNHPSVLFWSNGNEGGHNRELDDDFLLYDPQQRPVLILTHHADRPFNGLNSKHYPDWAMLNRLLNETEAVYMPSELLHGLYDGGHGASLADYWGLMSKHPNSGGAFFWVFADEAIRRPDQYGALDAHMTDAPDGILGPYREKEGSFYTVKEIWSPVQIPMDSLPENFNGRLPVENHYSFSSLNRCAFEWELLDWNGPKARVLNERVVASGTAQAPNVAPGDSGEVRLSLPGNWREADALALTVRDWTGMELWRWVWPIKSAQSWAESLITGGDATVEAREEDNEIILETPKLLIGISRETGMLTQVRHVRETRDRTVKNRSIDLTNGPSLSTGEATLQSISHRPEGNAQVVEATYTGNLKSVTWKLHGSSWIELSYVLNHEGPVDFVGVNFDFTEREVYGVRWLGGGPYRVWKNRLEGARFGLWEKGYNDTPTGRAPWQYPEFKGYHSNVYWAMIETMQARINIINPAGDGYLRLFTPGGLPWATVTPPFPDGQISWMEAIPPIGQKFVAPYNEEGPVLGPASAKVVAEGDYSRTLFIGFGVE